MTQLGPSVEKVERIESQSQVQSCVDDAGHINGIFRTQANNIALLQTEGMDNLHITVSSLKDPLPSVFLVGHTIDLVKELKIVVKPDKS